MSDPLRATGPAPRREEDRPCLLALEERLRADGEDGPYRHDLLDRLRAAQAALRGQLDRGVPPAEYRRLLRVAEAYDAACSVVAEYRP